MERKPQYPYRATKLWNEILFAFRFGMPLKKHRRHMKIHESCFTSSEATDWLHFYLRNSHYFGPHVTRTQTVQLLKKFYKSDVFEDVGKKCKKRDNKFADDNHLYRFTPIPTSPQKNVKNHVRTPLAVINSRHFPKTEQWLAGSYNPLEIKPLPSTPSKFEVAQVPKKETSVPSSNIHPSFAILLWKKLVFRRLMSLLGAITLDDILDARSVSGQILLHNMTRLSDNGVVAITDKSDDFPDWILLAMKCLARWPNASGSGSCLPNYPGFAVDVFQVIKEYLLNQSEPLIPRDLYKLFLRILSSVPSIREYLSQSESHKCDCLAPVRTIKANLKTSTPITAEDISTDKNQLQCTSLSDVLGSTRRGCEDIDSRHQDVSSICSGSVVDSVSSHLGKGSLHQVPKQTSKSRIRRSVSLPKLHVHPKQSNMAAANEWDSANREIHTSMPIDLETVGNSIRDLTRNYHTYYHQDPADVAFINSYGSSYLTACSSSQTAIQNSSEVAEATEPYSYRIRKLEKKFDSNGSFNTSSSSSLDYDCAEPQCQSFHDLINLQRENCDFISNLATGSATSEEVFSQREFEFCTNGRVEEQEYSGISDNVPNARCQKCCCYAGDLAHVINQSDQLDLIKMLQVATLLLHPSERRKVHSMLQLFQKMTSNDNLVLHPRKSVKILLIETFSICFLRAKEECDKEDQTAAILTGFLIDHVNKVFTPPIDLRKDFETLCQLHSEKEKIRYGLGISSGVTYCRQVSQKKYEEQKFSTSMNALSKLLQDIVHDPHLTDRDRQKKLKQFKENHPEVYSSQFPPQNGEHKNGGRMNLISRIKNFRL